MNITTIPLDRWIGHDPEFKYNERTLPIRYIVLHTTGGTNSLNWLSRWNRADAQSAQNTVSIHYLVHRDGTIFEIIPEPKRAWHVGKSVMRDGETDGNSASIGIEIEHLNEPDYPDAQLNSVAQLVLKLMKQYDIDGKHVVSHASVARPLGRKIDPVNFDWAAFWQRVASLERPPEAPGGTQTRTPYSEHSLVISSPQIDAQKLIDYLWHKHEYQQYKEEAVREILGHYVTYGKLVGVDYVMAIAQMIHETGWLESWWSARPRRNPAGIGVTGQTTTKDPNDKIRWALAGPSVWRKGQSFESWNVAVQHHLARLLMYAAKDEDLTPVQLEFTKISRDRGNLAHLRGIGRKWLGFNGVWAVPGRTYAQKLASISNSFIHASQ